MPPPERSHPRAVLSTPAARSRSTLGVFRLVLQGLMEFRMMLITGSFKVWSGVCVCVCVRLLLQMTVSCSLKL